MDKEFIPYYRGFKGEIIKVSEKKFKTTGVYQIKKDKIIITELPIGTWNEEYIEFLEKSINITIKDYKDLSTDKDVHIEIILKDNIDDVDINEILKLSSSLSTTNMNLFDNNDKLKNYNHIQDICDDFIKIRLEYYENRRIYLMNKLKEEKKLLKNKYTYIEELLNDTIDLRKKSLSEVNSILESKNYSKYNDNFNYLIKMSMDSVCEDNVLSLKENYMNKKKELEYIKNVKNSDLWVNELNILKKELDKSFKL